MKTVETDTISRARCLIARKLARSETMRVTTVDDLLRFAARRVGYRPTVRVRPRVTDEQSDSLIGSWDVYRELRGRHAMKSLGLAIFVDSLGVARWHDAV
jgi:hypothetical protein